MPIKEFEPVVEAMSLDGHLRLASKAVKAGLASMRDAAEHLAAAADLNAPQRQLAKAVGKSVGWVNRLLNWRKAGYPDTPFGPQSKQSRKNKKDSAPVQSTEQDDDIWGLNDEDAKLDTEPEDETSSSDSTNGSTKTRDEKKSGAKGSVVFSEDTRRKLIRALQDLQNMNLQNRAKAASRVIRILDDLDLAWEQLLIPANVELKKAA